MAAVACGGLFAGQLHPVAAQPHDPAPLVHEVQASGDRDTEALRQQVYRLLQIAERNPVQDFSSLCRRVREKARVDHAAEQEIRAELLKLAQLSLEGRAYLDAALVRLQEQVPHIATAELLYLWGMTLTAWEEPANLQSCTVQRRTKQAIVALTRLRNSFPAYEASRTLNTLGLLYARDHKFEHAQDSYVQAIELSLDTLELSNLYANLGEVTMLSGDLEGAIHHYERAQQESHTPQERALSLWGQAVVLDRLGEHDAALSFARNAMALEGGQMRVLHAEGVFFEPAHEVHIYEALGHEATAQDVPAFATFALHEAAAAYRAYLDQAGTSPDVAFVESARRNLDHVENLLLHQGQDAQNDSGRRSTTAETLP